MTTRFIPICIMLLATTSDPTTCQCQALTEPSTTSRDRASGKTASRETGPTRTPAQRLNTLIDRVHLEGVSARRAIEWWSATTAIPIVVHWREMELEGLYPEAEIHLRLRRVPANVVLKLILDQYAGDAHLIVEPSPWYIEILTRTEALGKSVVRIYDISDLLHFIPNFDDVPNFDLQSALANTSSGGGGRGRSSSGTLFGNGSGTEQREPRSEDGRATRADALVRTIRDTIEPGIWQAHGGEHASIRHYRRRLVVNAPLFVHRQIGFPRPVFRRSPGQAPRARKTDSPVTTRRSRRVAATRASTRTDGISGIGRSPSIRVSAVRP